MNKVTSGRNKIEPNIPIKLFNETEPNQNDSQQPISGYIVNNTTVYV